MEMKDRIKKLRKELDLTQKEFSDRIGTTPNVLTNYETGRRNPSSSVINNICKTFNVCEDWLRTGEGTMFMQRTRNQIITDFLSDLIMEDATFKTRLIEALAELDERDWEGLEKLASKLISKKD